MNIKAVIFDLDGILLDTERLISECMVDAAAEKGWTITMDTIIDCIGTTGEQTERILCNAMGNGFPYDEIRENGEQKFRVYVEQNGIPFKKGVLRLLDSLDDINIPFGLATSTRRADVNEMLTYAGILDRFAATVCGDEVVNAKPDPEIYHKAAEKIGVLADEALVFEDSSNGIRAAASAGARVIWVPDLQDIPDDIRKKCFDEVGSLDAVCDRLGDFIG